MILGLDLALTTGFAVLARDGALVAHGAWCNRAPNEGRKAEQREIRAQLRFMTFQRELRDVIHTYRAQLDLVAFEHLSPHGSVGGAQMQLYGGWRALTLATSWDAGLRAEPVGNSTMRSTASPDGEPDEVRATPRGQRKARREAWKSSTVRLAKERWSISRALTDDEADALWVAESARLRIGAK